MLKRYYFIFFLSISLNTLAQTEKRVISEISQITVFLNRAQINAAVKTTIPVGISKIVVEDIASTIDQQSIKIGGKGDFTLLSVNFQPNFLNKKTKALQDSIRMTEEEMNTVKMLLEVANNEQNMVMANAEIKSESDGLIPEDFKEMIDFFRTKLTEIGTRKLQLNRQLRELTELKSRLEKQQNTDPSRNMPLGDIVLTVSANTATNADLSLTYLVYNAGWNPAYDIRVPDTNSDVQMTYKANVYQNTGLDWKNVKLTLSTIDPSAGGTKPELYPQYLSFYTPPPAQVYTRSAKVSMEAPMAGAMKMEESNDMVSSANFTQVTETTLSVNFDISIPYSIKSGGKPEAVEIRQYTLPADYKYYLVPKYDTNAFLVTKLKDWEQYNLLPGEANVYFEGTFVGKTFVNGSGTKEELLISLGRDKKIIAERKEILDYKARRTIGSNIRENFGYQTVIRNTKNEMINLVIEDQLPVSQDSDISVSVEDISGAVQNAQDGKLTWELSIPPAQSREIQLKYEVKYPKDKTINGL